MSQNPDTKITQLEKQLNLALKQLAELNQRVSLLERENNRRRNEINQIASALNRK